MNFVSLTLDQLTFHDLHEAKKNIYITSNELAILHFISHRFCTRRPNSPISVGSGSLHVRVWGVLKLPQ